MKAFTVIVLSLFLAAGLVGAVGAQSDGQKDAQQSSDVKVDVKPPDLKVPDVKIEGKIETKEEAPAASPRTDPGGGGRVLGMNTTVAIVAAVVLVSVVILALVAMTRRTTY